MQVLLGNHPEVLSKFRNEFFWKFPGSCSGNLISCSSRSIPSSGVPLEVCSTFLLKVPQQVSFRVSRLLSLAFTSQIPPEVTLKVISQVSLGIRMFSKEFFLKFHPVWCSSESIYSDFWCKFL